MRKVAVVAGFLAEKNHESIRNACKGVGFEAVFFNTPGEAEGNISDAEILYCSYSKVLPFAPNILWCQTSNAGVNDFVASGRFDSGEILLTNSSGSYGRAIAEHVIMVTLMLMRRMPEYLKVIAEHDWVHNKPIRSIIDSRICIAGTGDLGRNIARRFQGLEAKSVIGISRSGREADGFDAVYAASEADEKLRDLDVLVLCMPDTPETRGFLSAERIAALPDNAYVVNVGRGTAVDQDALIDALNSGHLGGAALDVVAEEPLPKNHPLWTAPNCIITPHTSGDMGLPYTVDRTVEIFCENIKRYAAGEELLNRIDTNEGY